LGFSELSSGLRQVVLQGGVQVNCGLFHKGCYHMWH
jgi:hypothetical protein